MEFLVESIDKWYPVIFILSALVALLVWTRASRRKARLEIEQAAELINGSLYRNRQPRKEKYECIKQ